MLTMLSNFKYAKQAAQIPQIVLPGFNKPVRVAVITHQLCFMEWKTFKAESNVCSLDG